KKEYLSNQKRTTKIKVKTQTGKQTNPNDYFCTYQRQRIECFKIMMSLIDTLHHWKKNYFNYNTGEPTSLPRL
ncbi:MAG: hypothetical protein ACE5RP_01635, partial [Nitrosopumilus sp.]